jgi:hypothetical protein
MASLNFFEFLGARLITTTYDCSVCEFVAENGNCYSWNFQLRSFLAVSLMGVKLAAGACAEPKACQRETSDSGRSIASCDRAAVVEVRGLISCPHSLPFRTT